MSCGRQAIESQWPFFLSQATHQLKSAAEPASPNIQHTTSMIPVLFAVVQKSSCILVPPISPKKVHLVAELGKNLVLGGGRLGLGAELESGLLRSQHRSEQDQAGKAKWHEKLTLRSK